MQSKIEIVVVLSLEEYTVVCGAVNYKPQNTKYNKPRKHNSVTTAHGADLIHLGG